jgi:transposase-like protein
MLQSNQKIIRHKVGLLNLAEELGNVSKACQMMGLSRDTFYRYRDAVEEGGVEALLEKPRRVPNLKNRIDLDTENAVVAYAVEYPAYGQVRVSNELRKRGVFVSATFTARRDELTRRFADKADDYFLPDADAANRLPWPRLEPSLS